MDNVVKLKGETALHGAKAIAEVVTWLRQQADDIESGEARPVHKAVLIVFEDCSGSVRTNATFCNTTMIERAGIVTMALHDILKTD